MPAADRQKSVTTEQIERWLDVPHGGARQARNYFVLEGANGCLYFGAAGGLGMGFVLSALWAGHGPVGHVVALLCWAIGVAHACRLWRTVTHRCLEADSAGLHLRRGRGEPIHIAWTDVLSVTREQVGREAEPMLHLRCRSWDIWLRGQEADSAVIAETARLLVAARSFGRLVEPDGCPDARSLSRSGDDDSALSAATALSAADPPDQLTESEDA